MLVSLISQIISDINSLGHVHLTSVRHCGNCHELSHLILMATHYIRIIIISMQEIRQISEIKKLIQSQKVKGWRQATL